MNPGAGEKGRGWGGRGSAGAGPQTGAGYGFATAASQCQPHSTLQRDVFVPIGRHGQGCQPSLLPTLPAWPPPCSITCPRVLPWRGHLCRRPVEHSHRGAFQVERKRLMKADFINRGCHGDDCCLPELLYEQ